MLHINKNRKSILLLLICIITLVYFLFSLRKKDNYPAESNLVSTTLVIKKNVPRLINLPGTAETYQYIDLKSQVDGKIIKINFEEGQVVKAGQILFEIDPQEFKNQLKQAQANLAKDQAQLINAEGEEKRYNQLLKAKAVSQEQYAQILSNRDALIAAVTADQNIINNIELQISYCSISTPVSGKIGESFYRVGSLVQAQSATPLITINEVSPILVTFYLPEPLFIGALRIPESNKIEISVKTSSNEMIDDGKIIFIDNNVNTQTGTIKMKAIVANDDKILWPGQSVETILSIKDSEEVIVIPSNALHLNQDGQYVFVVNNNIAELRNIEILSVSDDNIVVTKGLNVGEIVVTDGAFRLTNGSKVVIKKGN